MAGIGLNRSRQAPAEETPSFGAIAERFRRAGDLERAIALCQEGLKKFPNQLSARVTLGWAYLDKGEYDHARQELERVIRRAPDNLAAIRGLAELHDRAEHAVSGLGPDGMWVPAEETPEEPDAVSPVAQGSAPAEPEPFEAAMPAAPPPLPVPALESSNDDVNPLSLIETPAQAAVAHSGADVAPVVSVFEQVIDHATVLAASEAPIVEDAADWREPDVTPAGTPLTALQEIAEIWEPAVPVSASEPANDAVLLAENAEVELDRVASEFGVSDSDPVASEVVIDLPEADDVLAGELEQFEATQPVEETSEFEAAALDRVLSPGGIDAAEELEALGSVFSAAANDPEPELVLQLEEEEDLLELQEATELVVEPAAALAAVEETAAAEAAAEEVAQAPAVPEAWQLADTVVASTVATSEAEPEPEVVSKGAVELVPEVVPEPELALASEPLVAAVIDAISETELEPEEDLVVAAGVTVAEPDGDVAEPAEVLPERVEVAAAADDGDFEDEASDVSSKWTVPDVPWMPPAGATAGVPAMDASAARMTEEEMHQLFPPPAPPPPAPARGAAPIARLESFLQKVASRRLHLSPDSVA